MVVPARPAAGAVVDEVWGQVAHDTAVANDIQFGTAAISIAASTQGSVVVTFPRPFASAPQIIAMIVSGAGAALNLFCQASGASPTSATFRLSSISAITVSNIGINWVAIGPRA